MVEIHIRGLTKKRAEIISELLGCLADSFSSEPDSYKEEFGESVTEVYMDKLNKKCVNALRKCDKFQKDNF